MKVLKSILAVPVFLVTIVVVGAVQFVVNVALWVMLATKFVVVDVPLMLVVKGSLKKNEARLARASTAPQSVPAPPARP